MRPVSTGTGANVGFESVCIVGAGRVGKTIAARLADRLPTRTTGRELEVDDDDRPIYHAAAAFASSFLVTLHEVAAELIESAGAPAEALEPLMRRTMENGFRHNGPLVRGDWQTVERHREAIRSRRPQLLPLYEALTDATATLLKVR